MKSPRLACLLTILLSTLALAQSTPDPAAQGKIVENYGKLPLTFEANQGQTDPRVKFLSRGSGYTLFLTANEAVFSLRANEAQANPLPVGGGLHSKAGEPLPQPESTSETEPPSDNLAASDNAAAARRQNKAHGASRGCTVVKDQAPAGRKNSCDPYSVAPRTNTVLRMKLLHANPAAKITGADELPGKSNYFIGNDTKKWRSNVPTYAKVKYQGVYPGVDLVYYGSQRELEYDFVVAPGADPRRIQFDVRGAMNIHRDQNGDLVLQTATGEIRWRKPIVYQESNGVREPVDGRYLLKRGRVSFEVANYDSRRALTIDPALAHSTYLGGSGTDSGNGIAADSSGNAYITGSTASADFPTTKGAFQPVCSHGCSVAFITKLNRSGSALIYSTYLGGSNTNAYAIALDAAGDAYVTGSTNSTNFPVTSGAFQTTCPACGNNAYDAFVSELNPTGSGLVYSTFLGGIGEYYDCTCGLGIAINASGEAYVTGSAGAGFPTTPGAFQTTDTGVFVTEFNATGSALIYSANFGGSRWEQSGKAIALDPLGNAYITGYTYSTDFPVTPGAFDLTCNACIAQGGYGYDGFVTALNASGSALIYSTYLGGSGYNNGLDIYGDEALAIAVDLSGNAYVTGQTYSTDFPTTPGAFQTKPRTSFLTQLNPSGSALVYSTYFAGSGFAYDNDSFIPDAGLAIAIDPVGDAYIVGSTCSGDFPTTPGAFQPQANATWPCAGFLSEMNPEGTALVYSTFLGGTPKPFYPQQANAVALDASGDVYIAGQTSAPDFPTTPGAFQTALDGTTDAFFTKFVPGPQLWPLAVNFGNQGIQVTSPPQAVTFTNDDIAVPISVSSISLTGADPADFSQTNNCTLAANLPPGKTCTVHVTFTPATTGNRSASLTFTDSGAGSPQHVGLSGTGTPPAVTLSPTSLNFGNQTIGVASTPQISTLTNTGSGLLTVSSIIINGPNSPDFSQTNTCSSPVQPGNSCQISVTFTPSTQSSESASVSITDNAPGSPQSLPLAGTGAPPTLTFTPPNLTFGNQLVKTTSPPQPVMLTTNGTLTISSITASTQFAQTNNCGSGLPAGGSCTINVTFTPSAPGVQNGSLMLTDSGAGSPQSVPLSGTGVQPAVTLSPPRLIFGNQTVNMPSGNMASTLENSGTSTLTITSINLGGANKNDFTEGNNCPSSLPPGGTCQINVTFTPSSTGQKSANVSVTDNAPGSPQSLPLSGVGVLPAVTFSPTNLTFPNQVVYTTSAPQKVNLKNTGLGILDITNTGASGEFGDTTNCGQTLSPGASCTINVTFQPTDKGVLTGAISVTDNAPGSPQQVPLTGTGTYVQLSPASVNFGNQPLNSTSLPKYITFVNKGSGPVNFTGTGISITGTDQGDFAETNNCGTSVPSGGNCKIKVTFTPSALGQRTADVSISDDGGGSPQTVPLTGTGTP
jgi:hypothetical protein